MSVLRSSFLAVATAAALTACGSSVPLNEGAKVETRDPTAGQGAGAGAGAAGQSGVATVDLGKNQNQAADNLPRVVFFDYDSYVVKDQFRPVVESHARRLSADKQRRVTVEGHTDERGGSEYNLALGQKRAEAVARALVLLGVTDNQVEAVSFGKERPAVQGADESAWAQNRRAEIRDR